jgi:NAD(P)-dependent dehydrogenase (short-subunit alcohol dehydrogenase family)
VTDSEGSLAGLVALVTGGAGHLGSAMTTKLAARGARVVVGDLDTQRATDHAAMMTASGLDAMAVELDVSSEPSVDSAFSAVEDRFGGVDILVNNAAPSRLIAQDSTARDLDLGVWDALFDVIVRGALLCTRRALPHMTEQGAGTVVNIASIHALAGDADLTAYPTAKAALVGLSRTVATQYGRYGVRSNSITLGTIPYPNMSEAARQSKVRHQLLGREGVPADVANLVAFLASPDSSFLTGANYLAEGGVLAHLPSYADGGTFDLMRAKE